VIERRFTFAVGLGLALVARLRRPELHAVVVMSRRQAGRPDVLAGLIEIPLFGLQPFPLPA
jgi:hypothetical protein